MNRRASDTDWWRRWIESRWLMVTMVTIALQFYLSVNGIDLNGTFARVAIVALGAGQINNTWGRSRPSIRSTPLGKPAGAHGDQSGGGRVDPELED